MKKNYFSRSPEIALIALSIFASATYDMWISNDLVVYEAHDQLEISDPVHHLSVFNPFNVNPVYDFHM
jgi:hypothetical protein